MHGILERCNGFAVVDQTNDLVRCRVKLRKVIADIALDTAGVVSISV